MFLNKFIYLFIFGCIGSSLLRVGFLQLCRAHQGSPSSLLNVQHLDFPGGTVVKNPPANAEDTGSSPGPGRSHMSRSHYAHAPQLLSLPSGARVPQYQSLHAQSPCSATREATAVRSPRTATKSSPRSLQLERAGHSNEEPKAARNK